MQDELNVIVHDPEDTRAAQLLSRPAVTTGAAMPGDFKRQANAALGPPRAIQPYAQGCPIITVCGSSGTAFTTTCNSETSQLKTSLKGLSPFAHQQEGAICQPQLGEREAVKEISLTIEDQFLSDSVKSTDSLVIVRQQAPACNQKPTGATVTTAQNFQALPSNANLALSILDPAWSHSGTAQSVGSVAITTGHCGDIPKSPAGGLAPRGSAPQRVDAVSGNTGGKKAARGLVNRESGDMSSNLDAFVPGLPQADEKICKRRLHTQRVTNRARKKRNEDYKKLVDLEQEHGRLLSHFHEIQQAYAVLKADLHAAHQDVRVSMADNKRLRAELEYLRDNSIILHNMSGEGSSGAVVPGAANTAPNEYRIRADFQGDPRHPSAPAFDFYPNDWGRW